MFTPHERDLVQQRLLDHARADDKITAAAVTGSLAAGSQDEWSDVDLLFAVHEGLDRPAVVEAWTELLQREFGVVHHWNLSTPSTTYRVFLLASGLEVDLGFAAESDFAAAGPRFRPVFGDHATREPHVPPSREEIGLGWHHILHARACIERGRPWQAEWLINGVRDHVVTLACLRLDLPPHFARGADQLPEDVTAALEGTLVRSLGPDELRRALRAATDAYLAEVRAHDEELAQRLEPLVRA